jgi:excinuclease ABC subunit B
VAEEAAEYVPLKDIPKRVAALQKEMRDAAGKLEFERAAELRDRIQKLQTQELALRGA